MTSDERRLFHEVSARLDAGAAAAAQALLGHVEKTAAIEGLLGLIEHCRLCVKALEIE